MKNQNKILPRIIAITCLLLGGLFAYRSTLSNLATNQLETKLIKKNPSIDIATALPPASAQVLAKKHRVLSEREKYEVYLSNHAFNNRVHAIKDKEPEFETGEEREARKEREEQAENKSDRPDLAFEQDFLRTMNPTLKRPTPEVLPDIIRKNRRGASSNAKPTSLPGDNTSVTTNWKELGPTNVGGRTRALTWDPTTANKVWAGGVSGGLWYNTNITDANSSWVKVNDFWSSLSVTKIAFDPTNARVAYVSTGEGFGVGASIGAGIWKTTDGGSTWTQLSATANMRYINDLIVRKENISGTDIGVIYAAVDEGSYNGKWFSDFGLGMYRSADFGTTWTQVMPSAANGANYVPASISVSASNRIWVGTKSNSYGGDQGGGRVLYSDNGTSWTVSNTLNLATSGRVTVACAPSDANYIYSFMEGASSGTAPIVIRKSTNNGVSWADVAIPVDADSGVPADDFTRGQVWYDQAMAVDPNNAQNLLIGGVDLFASLDGGDNWGQIGKWSNNNNLNDLKCSYVHADQHAICFKPGSSTTVIFGNDGGIFYSADILNSATKDVIAARNKNYNVTQFYSAAIHPIAGYNYHLAGAQDNGTQLFHSDNLNTTLDVNGGDGGYCFIDQVNPNYQIVSYVNNNFTLFYPNAQGDTTYMNLLSSDNTGSFINPACYDNNIHALYTFKSSDATSGGSIYRVKNITHAPAVIVDSLNVTNLTAAATAFKVSPYTTTSTTLLIGTASGKLIKLANADGATPVETDITGTLPTGSISCIEMGSSENELIVTFFNYGLASKIYYSANGGTTWVSKMGDFPDMPVRWAMFNPNHSSTEVILATELGIYGTINFNNTNPTWTAKNSGFSNVRTDMFQIRASDKMVIAATFGRGLFSSMGFSESLPNISSFTPASAAAGATVTITGTNLTGATSVSFGGSPAASFIVVNNTTITAVVGTGASGSVSVTTSFGIATKTGFTFISSAAALTASVTFQPSCTVATGTITVSSPTAGFTFSIDSVTYTNTTGIFTGVVAGTYKVTSKNASNVISPAVTVTVTAQPATPAAPTASVTAQPTCTVATGTITVSSATTGLTFSIDSINYTNTTGIFSSVTAGSYSITSRNTSTCTSSATLVTITAQPVTPAVPTISAGSSITFCEGNSVVLTSNTASANQWYKNNVEISGAVSNTYSANTSGSYTDTIVSPTGGCKTGSLPTVITVKSALPKPVITWNGSNLSTNSSATSFQWSLNNVSLFGATAATYKPIAIGSYKIQITNSEGCNTVSDSFNLVVTALNNPATTSVSNLATIFPNPASPVVLVKFREAPSTTLEIRLVTNDGRTVQLVKTKDKLTTIPINNLPSGNYFIRITGNNYNQTEGVIISK